MSAPNRDAGWWVEEQSSWCTFCWQAYPSELGRACAHCDGTICPQCAVTAGEVEVECPDCSAAEAEP
jgi:hypothetical protein